MISTSYKIFNSIGAYLPCVILFGIIFFVYFSFSCTYLYPLLLNSYEWERNNGETREIVAFSQLLQLEDHFFSFFKLKEYNFDENRSKGIVIFCILHFLLFVFLCSVIKTILTNPGNVPSEWNKELEEKLHVDFEKEQKILKQVRMEARRQQKMKMRETYLSEKRKDMDGERASLIERTDNLFKSKEEEKSEKKLEESREKDEKEKLLQGRQGTNSDTSEVTPYGESENYSIDDEQEEELDPEVLKKMNQIVLLTIVERENKRFCSHCQKFKPLRTHHCKQCSKCILKMDHHCQWVLNCIGFYNYKYFMNMLIWANLTLIFLTIVNTRCVRDTALNKDVSFFTLFIIMLNYIFSIVLEVIIFCFTTFHFCLILAGKTTIEYCENKKDGKNGKYNYGKMKNFISVFGRNPLLWFLPLNPNVKSEGVRFEPSDI